MTTSRNASIHRRRPQEANAQTPAASDFPDRRALRPYHEGVSDTARRLLLFVESVQDHAIFMLDPGGYVTTWNEGAERIKGYRAEEIIGRHVSCFYTPEDVERGLPARLFEAAEADGRVEDEGWRVRQDGSRFWATVSITAVRDDRGRLEGFGKVTSDLTKHKHAEKQALGDLAGRLFEAQDWERRRISLSLSDGTSPSLETLRSKLHRVKYRPEEDAHQLIDDCLALAEFLSREIRTVSSRLYPPSLETDGLLVTLRTHLKGLAQQRGITVDVDFPAHMERVPPLEAAALYHVVQEFLARVLRATGSSRAKARIAVEDEDLTLKVGVEESRLTQDALQELHEGAGELGVTMAGMRERMVRLGGSLEIDSGKSGTWATATLPVPKTRKAVPE